MLVSLQIQGGPQELASVLAAIGGISMPVDAPVLPLPVPVQQAALPVTETKQKKAASKQTVAPVSEPETATVQNEAVTEVVETAQVKEEVESAAVSVEAVQQASNEPKAERLTLEKIRAVFNEKLGSHRDTIKGILNSFDSKGLTEFYGKATSEQHAEFFEKLTAL